MASLRAQPRQAALPPASQSLPVLLRASLSNMKPESAPSLSPSRVLAGRPIRALIGVIHLSRGKRGYVTPFKV